MFYRFLQELRRLTRMLCCRHVPHESDEWKYAGIAAVPGHGYRGASQRVPG